MIKILIVFIIGTIETFIYTAWAISATKKEAIKSSTFMFIYMVLYLGIISFALKDTDTWILILTYALSCALGNYLEILWETWTLKIDYWWWEKSVSYKRKMRFYKNGNNYEGYIFKLKFWLARKK